MLLKPNWYHGMDNDQTDNRFLFGTTCDKFIFKINVKIL